jgi:hypothetical protein
LDRSHALAATKAPCEHHTIATPLSLRLALELRQSWASARVTVTGAGEVSLWRLRQRRSAALAEEQRREAAAEAAAAEKREREWRQAEAAAAALRRQEEEETAAFGRRPSLWPPAAAPAVD